MISRRNFVAITGAAILAPRFAPSFEEVPTLLDHILLGCSDLDQGIAFVEQRSGVRAAPGGVHPGRGTRNALLSLGGRRYLEIIAPDPAQSIVETPFVNLVSTLKRLVAPRLFNWAAHPGDIEALALKLRQAKIAATGPIPGSRSRPDGRLLHWKTLNLADDRDGLLPFFIEWAAGSIHPSADAPAGCELERFAAVVPNPEEFSRIFKTLGLDAIVERAETSQLRARVRSANGVFEL